MRSKEFIASNNRIAGYFEQIKNIAETYLNFHYPAAPDPGDFAEEVQKRIDKILKEF